MNFKNHIVVFCWLIFIMSNTFSQNRTELKREQQKIKKDIGLIENLINETVVKKKESIVELNLIQKKIQFRNEFIENSNKEILILEQLIKENYQLIESLNYDLKLIKDEYARLIYNAYIQRRKENFLLYILSANSFNQAYKRIKYMQLFNDYKRRQIKLILAFSKVIKNKNIELTKQVELKEIAINSKVKELNSITKEKGEQKRLLGILQQRESELRREIVEKKKIARGLENEIAKIIAEERKNIKNKSLYEMLTPDEKILSDKFELNKGRLPWPTAKGVVTGKFGIHDHPVLKNVKIRNDGIFISTVNNSEVLAVFSGIVSTIFSLPGSNYGVIIKHGNYFTLYNNLVKVSVKEGDKVNVKQSIGKVYNDIEKGESVLHFQIWKEMEKNDPEIWLSR